MLKFPERRVSAHKQNYRLVMQWLTWKGGTGDTYQIEMQPVSDNYMEKYLQKLELGYLFQVSHTIIGSLQIV